MKVRIGPATFPVFIVHEDDDTYGSFHMSDGIEINNFHKQVPSVMAATVLHECFHAMWEVYRWPKRLTEEEACARLEAAFLDFIYRNPTLIRELQDAVDGIPLTIKVKDA